MFHSLSSFLSYQIFSENYDLGGLFFEGFTKRYHQRIMKTLSDNGAILLD